MCNFFVKLFCLVFSLFNCFLFATPEDFQDHNGSRNIADQDSLDVAEKIFSVAAEAIPRNTREIDDVRAIAENLLGLNITESTEIPPIVIDLLRNLPNDVKVILINGSLYELSKEQLATIPVPLLYLLPKHQLYNLSGYQHGMLLRIRPDILSLADLVVNTMEDPDTRDTFLRALQYTKNLSGAVQNELGGNIAGWKSTEIEFRHIYKTGDPLAVHIPLSFMMEMSEKLKHEMMFYLRTTLLEEDHYRGSNLVKWLALPVSYRRVYTKLCIEDNNPAPLHEWKFNHVNGFSHLLSSMTLAEFSNISLSERFNYKYILKAPLTTLQIRYLFEKTYPMEQLYFVEFEEYAHLLSALQPQHLNKFFVNATDMLNAKYHLNNITFATAKQIAEIMKVQKKWTSSDSTSESSPTSHATDPSRIFLYTLPAADIAKMDASNVDLDLLNTLDTSKLSFPQIYMLGHKWANLSLTSPHHQFLLQALPAQMLQRIEPNNLPFDILLNLLRYYSGTNEAFSATLMNRLKQNLGIRHLETLLLNPARKRLLQYLPVTQDPRHVYQLFSQLYEQPLYKPLIDQLDSSLVRTIMPAEVSYEMYIKDRFLFKGMTCAQLDNVDTYELVVFTQDYFNYIRSTKMAATLSKQLMTCWLVRLQKYIQIKPVLPLLNSDVVRDKTNPIDKLSQHELRAFGVVLIMFKSEVIAESQHVDKVVQVAGEMPREFLDNMNVRSDYELILRKYIEKNLISRSLLGFKELLTIGNLTHYIPVDLLANVDPKAFKLLIETQLIDSRLCGDVAYMRQMEELIVRAFGHVSTWTPDILVLLKDFLLALSDDQMNQIPARSWTSMADLIVTSYAEESHDEYGLVRPFYQGCMVRLNQTKAQNYYQSLSRLTKFYLAKIQLHMNTVKSTAEIIEHQMQFALTTGIQLEKFKPQKSGLDDDDMANTLTIYEPDIPEVEDDTTELTTETTTTTTEITTTTEASTTTTTTKATTTTTESATKIEEKTTEGRTEPSNEIYQIDAHNETTNGSTFHLWEVYARPKKTTTILNEVSTTIKMSEKSNDDFDGTESNLNISVEKSEEEFMATNAKEKRKLSGSNENNGELDDNVDIIEIEDSLTTEDRKNEKKIPCDDDTCVAQKVTDSTKSDVTTGNIQSKDTDTSTAVNGINTKDVNYVRKVRKEDSYLPVVDEAIDVNDSTEFSSKIFETTESSTQYQTTARQIQETTKSDSVRDKAEVHQEVSTLGNEYESSTDVIANDLVKWNDQHVHNHEDEEITKNKAPQTLNFTERLRHNFDVSTILPSETEHTTSNINDYTTPRIDHGKIYELISKMPGVPSEEPGHVDNHFETRSNTIDNNNNPADVTDNDFIIKSEDRKIIERVHFDSRKSNPEDTINEITEGSNRIEENTISTKEYDDKLGTVTPQISTNEDRTNETTTTTTPFVTTTEYENNEKILRHRNQKYDSFEREESNEAEKKDNLKNIKPDYRYYESVTYSSYETTDSASKYRDPNQNQNKRTEEVTTEKMDSYRSKEETNERHSSENRYNENNSNEHSESNRWNNYPYFGMSESNENNGEEMGETNENFNNNEKNNYYDSESSNHQRERTTNSRSEYLDPNQYQNKLTDELSTEKTESSQSREQTYEKYGSENVYNEDNGGLNKYNYENRNKIPKEDESKDYGLDETQSRNNGRDTNDEDSTFSNHNSKESSNEWGDEQGKHNKEETHNKESNQYLTDSTTTQKEIETNRHPSSLEDNNEEDKTIGKLNTMRTEASTDYQNTVLTTVETKIISISSTVASSFEESEVTTQDFRKDAVETSTYSKDTKPKKIIETTTPSSRIHYDIDINIDESNSQNSLEENNEEDDTIEKINTKQPEADYQNTVLTTDENEILTIKSTVAPSYKESEITAQDFRKDAVETSLYSKDTTPKKIIETTTGRNEIDIDINESNLKNNSSYIQEAVATTIDPSHRENKSKELDAVRSTEVANDDKINYNKNEDLTDNEVNNETPFTTEFVQEQDKETSTAIDKYKFSEKLEDSEEKSNEERTEAQNKTKFYLSETPILWNPYGVDHSTKDVDIITTSKIPSNYKHAAFIPQTIILPDPMNMDILINNKVGFKSTRAMPDEKLVVYDTEDVTSDDIAEENANGEEYSKSRNIMVTTEQITKETFEHVTFFKGFTEIDDGLSDVERMLKVQNDTLDVILDVSEEETLDSEVNDETHRGRRRRRFVMNQYHEAANEANPCEALNILGPVTEITNMEDVIVKLDKDALLDCLDLVNKINIPKRARQSIINKFYREIDQYLPLLGNILADLSLEEIRSITMNDWSLEVLAHMNSINDTKKAELLVEKYLMSVNRNVLNVNEMIILNNMLCYLSQKLLKTSLLNITPVELLSILKHITTCSEKCLSTFTTLAVKVLGSPMSWKYEEVYSLGTVPSGLNQTMWKEFVQQKHLKYNMNEHNYKCLKENTRLMDLLVVEEVIQIKPDIELNSSPVQKDESSSSGKISNSCFVILVQLYLFKAFARYFL